MMNRDVARKHHALRYWLAMPRIKGIGARTWLQLLDRLETPEAIFNADSGVLSDCGLGMPAINRLRQSDQDCLQSDLDWLDDPANRLVTWHDSSYPQLLKQIHDPPPVLYASGDTGLLKQLQISIVGSRNPSPDGKRMARDFSRQLAGLGITITSGLASGLDSCAHQGALDAGGTTIAVLGSGLDVIYPAKNRGLAESIRESGVLVSEFPPDARPVPANFPRRNRIISGLSAGTLVVEATLRSGSLITARLAMEQGREVYAIPGSIYNPLSRGCHKLISDGAKLVEDIAGILEEIAPLAAITNQGGQEQDKNDKTPGELDEYCKLLLENIAKQPVSIDMLVDETRLGVQIVASSLIKLELNGLVESLPGGEYIRTFMN
jgi:DNA processing protein